MAKVSILMGIICLGVIGRAGMYNGGGVGPSLPARGIYLGSIYSFSGLDELPLVGSPQRGERSRVLSIARAEVGVREIRNNDGKRVREYLSYTGIKVPAPYCASYISWCFYKAGYTQPRTAWSPAMFPASRIVKEPKPADVFGLWFPELKRIAHVGLVEKVKGDWIYTLEGNSNNNGSRNGDGVYQRMRHKRTIYKYSDWYGTE